MSTVRQGTDLDYSFVVLEDLGRDTDAEMHEASVKVLGKTARVIRAEEWVRELEGGEGRVNDEAAMIVRNRYSVPVRWLRRTLVEEFSEGQRLSLRFDRIEISGQAFSLGGRTMLSPGGNFSDIVRRSSSPASSFPAAKENIYKDAKMSTSWCSKPVSKCLTASNSPLSTYFTLSLQQNGLHFCLEPHRSTPVLHNLQHRLDPC